MQLTCEQCSSKFTVNPDKYGNRETFQFRCKNCGYISTWKNPGSDEHENLTNPRENSNEEVAETHLYSDDEISRMRSSTGGNKFESLEDSLRSGTYSSINDLPTSIVEESPISGLEISKLEISKPSSVGSLPSISSETEILESQSFSLSRSAHSSPSVSQSVSQAKPQNEPDRTWFLAIGDEQVGPLILSEVQQKWQSGLVNHSTLCWKPGLDTWKPISEMPELGSLWSSMQNLATLGTRETPTSGIFSSNWTPQAASSLASLANHEFEESGTHKAAEETGGYTMASQSSVQNTPLKTDYLPAAGSESSVVSTAYYIPGGSEFNWLAATMIGLGVIILSISVLFSLAWLNIVEVPILSAWLTQNEPHSEQNPFEKTELPQIAAVIPEAKQQQGSLTSIIPTEPAIPQQQFQPEPSVLPSVQDLPKAEQQTEVLQKEMIQKNEKPVSAQEAAEKPIAETNIQPVQKAEAIVQPKPKEKAISDPEPKKAKPKPTTPKPKPAKNVDEEVVAETKKPEPESKKKEEPQQETAKAPEPAPEPPKKEKVSKYESGDLLDFDGNADAPSARDELPDVLTKNQIRSIIGSKGGEVKICIKKQLSTDARFQGNVANLTFQILSSGETSEIEVSPDKFKGSIFAGCLKSSVKNWKFPKFKKPSIPIKNIPIPLNR